MQPHRLVRLRLLRRLRLRGLRGLRLRVSAGRSVPMALPRIGITTGDSAGIGPEVAGRAARDPSVLEVCEPVLYETPGSGACRPGVVSAVAGRAAYQAVTRAVRDAQAGRIDAVTTGPVNKQAWARAGLRWRGHTELLADVTGAGDVRMMFYAGRLSVVLATVHVPLAHVPALLTRERLETTIALAHAELPRFGVARPAAGPGRPESARRRGRPPGQRGAGGVRVGGRELPRAADEPAMPAPTNADAAGGIHLIADNRKARHDYHVFDTYEAGVVLLGTEVKAIREGRVNLKDSYGKV